jgi:hypothetical protein
MNLTSLSIRGPAESTNAFNKSIHGAATSRFESAGRFVKGPSIEAEEKIQIQESTQQAAYSSSKLPKKMEASHKSQDLKAANRGKTAVDQGKRPGWRVAGKKATEQTKVDARYSKA